MDAYEDGDGSAEEGGGSGGYSDGLKKSMKVHNVLPLWGNEASMNLNPLVLANIQSSSYFKVTLFKLKTYHEVVDEIYYQVKHMEPWEKGSRKTSGQTGMCGGVRGVGAGGIVSSAYCLLYKLYTLRLTRKQLNGLLTHTDSPYIRALGFMYIRYTQPPADLFDWYEQYLQDEEEIDVKAGGGQVMTIGQMLIQWLSKLDWFATLFPRIPVPIQKLLETKLREFAEEYGVNLQTGKPHAASAPAPSSTAGQYSSAQQQSRRRDEPQYDDEAQYRQFERDEARSRQSDHYRGDNRKESKYARSRSRSRSRSDKKNGREYSDRSNPSSRRDWRDDSDRSSKYSRSDDRRGESRHDDRYQSSRKSYR